MTDVARKKSHPSPHGGNAASTSAPSAAVFVVSFLAAFAAAGSAFGLGGFLGLGVGVVIGLVGAGVCAALAVQGTAGSTTKATALLDIALSDDAPAEPPAGFRAEPWASLYREVMSGAESKRTASMAVLEIERLRRGAGDAPPPDSHEPRPTHRSEDLVGHGEEIAARDVDREIADALRPYGEGLESIEADLMAVRDALRPDPESEPAQTGNGSNGAPAAMVDALVHTAADGIEDLAAGLMRANELAVVAERVTNRATLLALNAALEATRSGSEAFASIAEETRRLAEYAREATDTISRLSAEIEFKVGETIASIQSSSEDAKAAVASMSGGGAPAAPPSVAPATIGAVEALLGRIQALRGRVAQSVAASEKASGEGAEHDAAEPLQHAPSPVGDDAESRGRDESDGFTASDGNTEHDMAAASDLGGEREEAPDADVPAAPPAYGDVEVRGESAPEPDPEPIVVTLDASEEETTGVDPTEGRATVEPSPEDALDPAPVPAPDPDPAQAPEPEPSSGEARNEPVAAPKIPDWLEGIRPGENQ